MNSMTNLDVWDFQGVKGAKRCYETHPALPVGTNVIYGGSCSSPIVKDADIYIGFDLSMQRTKRAYPWEEGAEFLYRIMDMNPPDSITSYCRMLEYIALELLEGKKIHCGCIGGHGRTGMTFAALINVVTGEKDAITFVRENYCKKAVESEAQVRFLNQHFDIKKVPGAKTNHGGGGVSKGYTGPTGGSGWSSTPPPSLKVMGAVAPLVDRSLERNDYHITPAINDKLTLWGKSMKLFDKPNKSGRIKV